MRCVCAMALTAAMALAMPGVVQASDDGRYRIENIKRDIEAGSDYRTVNGTMMVDSATGKTWILDEQRGRWIPVGFRAPNLGTDVSVSPEK